MKNMRSYIGNITSNKDKQVADTSGREEMRQNLLKKARWNKAEKDVKTFGDEISGKRKMSTMILETFDNDGRPPKNISYESLLSQYEKFSAQQQWMQSFVQEFHFKMAELDSTRFEERKQVRAAQEEERRKENEEAYAAFTAGKEPVNLNSQLKDMIGRVMKKSSRAKELNSYAKEKMRADMHIVGAHQMESAIGYLFSDYLRDRNPKYAVEKDDHFRLLENEVERLEVALAEIDWKLVYLKEFLLSAEAYLKGY
jgi:hypothetical protein